MLDPSNPLDIKSIEKCRNIKNEIVSFGVSQKEIVKLLELLSLELEDTVLMRNIINTIKPQNSEQNQTKKESLVI